MTQGLVLQHLCLADSVASEVIGPGDLLSPHLEADPLVPAERSFHVAHPAHIALLDGRMMGRTYPPGGRMLVSNPVLLDVAL